MAYRLIIKSPSKETVDTIKDTSTVLANGSNSHMTLNANIELYNEPKNPYEPH